MHEDDALVWQELLDEVAAGRSQSHPCPFCREEGRNGEVVVIQGGEDPERLRLECRQCRRYIEGRLATP